MGRAIRGVFAVLVAFVCALCAAAAAQASLSIPSTMFSGSSTSGTSVPTAMAQFEAAAGGADNGTSPGQQGSGFRHLNWDAMSGLTPIPGGHTAAVARSSTAAWGIELGPQVAVANDGFASVNPHAGFAAFSPPDEWAPFNSHVTTFGIVAPPAQGSSPVPSATRGLGIVFLNVTAADTTTIQYYSGDALLGQAAAPVGATSFVGVLFRDPVVTRVVITLGTATMFGFDGSSVTPGGSDPTMLVAGDDVVLAEPGAGEPVFNFAAGAAVPLVLGSFDSGGPASEFTASVDWGDGTRSAATLVPESAGFAINGAHAYARAGSYAGTVTVNDSGGPGLATDFIVHAALRPTATSLSCSPTPVAVSASSTCIATVADATATGASAPTGLVTFSTTTPGATFAQDTGCLLGASAVIGVSTCVVQFTPGQIPPNQARVSATYAGDEAHAGSGTTAFIGVRPQRCSLKALSRTLHSAGLGVLVTCDARANVQIAVKAFAARHLKSKAFSLPFGTLKPSAVAAGRPTVLVVRPAPGVLRSLRAALRRHQSVSLKLTLTASSHGATRTTTTRVAAVRLG